MAAGIIARVRLAKDDTSKAAGIVHVRLAVPGCIWLPLGEQRASWEIMVRQRARSPSCATSCVDEEDLNQQGGRLVRVAACCSYVACCPWQ